MLYFSLKNPAKYVGRKPRKYTVPVPVPVESSNVGGVTGGVSGVGRASGRGPGGRGSGPGGGVEPIAAQAAAAAQVRTYRDNGVKHSTSSYNRVGTVQLLSLDTFKRICHGQRPGYQMTVTFRFWNV